MSGVTLLDYGVGNTASVRRAFERLGADAQLTSDPERVAASRRIVLPGVGAFAPARERLAATGLDRALAEAVGKGARVLGLCLGFQLLFEESHEFGVTRGLGLLRGRITPFPKGVRVPHIGWNQLLRSNPDTEPGILASVADGSYVYFVHSFRLEGYASEDVAARSDYGGGFPAAVARGQVWGCQFHPEKSSEVGRTILANFLADGEVSA
ncbi:MAG: imidazole glycerol phosphate synthase subunit HisH [Thermoanaerobaculia bacterium]